MAGEVFYDLVQETAGTVTGTGSYTLAGAVLGGVTFASRVGTSGIVRYCARAVDANGNPVSPAVYEIGQGTLSSSTTLARTSIKASSNSNNAVNWSGQTVYIALVDDAYGKDRWRVVQDFKLTCTSGSPWTTSDVTGVATLYATPYTGNQIALYNGSQWVVHETTERSLALGTLTSGKNYDIFAYNNSGTVTLESLAWTNDTTRATALTTQDGVPVKTGDTTRRYLGTFRTTSTTTTEDSFANRNLFDFYYPDLWKHTSNSNRLYYSGWGTAPVEDGYGWFGDGSDGSVTFDGSSTILGLVPSSSTYTLTRNIYCTNMTVNNGVTIKTGGFSIFCQNLLTNAGSINDDGNAGGNGSNGSAGSAGTGAVGNNNTYWGTAFTSGNQGAVDGAAGRRITTASNQAGQAGNDNSATRFIAGNGGIGGAATSPSTGAGGAGGTGNTPTHQPRMASYLLTGVRTNVSLSGWSAGGAGGGSGGVSQSSTGTCSSGGGGGGGGLVIISAQQIINTGTISANGGAGGNGYVSSLANQFAGGGGGGGGGFCGVLSRQLTGNTPTANGGAAGTNATFGTGAGSAAATGTAGLVITIYV